MLRLTNLLILFSVICLNAQTMLNPDRANTINPPGGGSETGEALAEDWEPTGSLVANWNDDEIESGNSIAENTDTVNSGTYAAKFLYGGSNAIGKISIGIPNVTKFYFRCYINISGGFYNGGGYNYQEILTFMDGTDRVMHVSGKSGSSGVFDRWYMRTYVGSGSAQGTGGNGVTLNQQLRLEVGYERGTTDDGWCTVRVDGDSIIGLTGLAHNSVIIDSLYLGSYTESSLSAGHFWIDDIKMDTTGTWIGAKP